MALFMGDAGMARGSEMIEHHIGLRAHLLKVGHHGSGYASTHAFIDAVKPCFAAISVGRHNLFGHPAPARMYGRTGSSTLDVTVADLANMGGLAAAANLATMMNVESDEDGGYEKNVDINGHRVHEKWTNVGKRSDLTEFVDNRYEVSVEGSGVAMDPAVGALRSIDMTKFQALGAAPRAGSIRPPATP